MGLLGTLRVMVAAVELGGCGKGGDDLYKTVHPILVFTKAVWGKRCGGRVPLQHFGSVTVLNTGIAFETWL